MPTTDLCADEGTALLAGVHPRLAVLYAPPAARNRLRDALATRATVLVVDAATVESRMTQAQARLDELHLEAVQRQQARYEDALAALGRADTGLADTEAALAGARSDVAQIDALESRMADAQAERDRAADAEADELQKVSDILRRRQRLAHQRRDAANALAQLRASGGDRPSADTRRQVANIEAALSRAETEQAEAEGKVEAALTDARDIRLAAVVALESADADIRLVVPATITASWPPGPPLPNCIADHRARLLSGVAEAEARVVQAQEAREAAGRHAEEQERALGRAHQARQLVDRATVITELLHPEGTARPEGAADRDGAVDRDGTVDRDGAVAGARVLLIDEAFAPSDLNHVGPALEQLSNSGLMRTVYLTEEPGVLSWAIELPHAVGGISGVAHGDPAGEPPPAYPSSASSVGTEGPTHAELPAYVAPPSAFVS